jgi:hypothetical protein
MADHVDESTTAPVLCQCVLVLTLGDTQEVLDVEVGEELFETFAGTLAGAISVEESKALRAFAFGEVGVYGYDVDAILLGALNG